MSNKKIEKACPYLVCIRSGSVCCGCGAKIGNGRELGAKYAERFCLRSEGYEKCAVYLIYKEAGKQKQ